MCGMTNPHPYDLGLSWTSYGMLRWLADRADQDTEPLRTDQLYTEHDRYKPVTKGRNALIDAGLLTVERRVAGFGSGPAFYYLTRWHEQQ